MSRITQSDLYAVLKRINELTNQEEKAYSNDTYNVGTYVLDWAYGGVRLGKITSSGGGQIDVTRRGTKREVYYYMQAFIAGYIAARHPSHNSAV
tara:strand:- start:4551 stop:4832 length:282 start_codon:yes stop_codon:yes gene_type:complete